MTRLSEAMSPVTISRPPEAESTLLSIIASENPFRNHWYAVTPVADLPQDRPYGIELFNTPLVVFFDKARGHGIAFSTSASIAVLLYRAARCLRTGS